MVGAPPSSSVVDYKPRLPRATVEERAGVLGHALRARRPLVGGLSLYGVSGRPSPPLHIASLKDVATGVASCAGQLECAKDVVKVGKGTQDEQLCRIRPASEGERRTLSRPNPARNFRAEVDMCVHLRPEGVRISSWNASAMLGSPPSSQNRRERNHGKLRKKCAKSLIPSSYRLQVADVKTCELSRRFLRSGKFLARSSGTRPTR